MKHSGQIRLIVLFLSSSYVVASTTSNKPVQCTRPIGKLCVIQTLPASDSSDGTAVEFPDLSKRTTLKVLEGALGNLTEPMVQKLPVRILWMESIGLKSIFVAPSFEELHLRDNQLTTLQSKSGASSSDSFNLKLLDVRQNRLKNASQLEPFVRLEEVYLDNNLFEQLTMDLFMRMPNLRVLSAIGNGLVRIVPPSSMLVLNDLVTLSLGHNRLSSIQMDKWQLPSLQTLLLSNNSLQELVGMDGFEQFYDLKKLELAGNRWNCGWLQRALANISVGKPQKDDHEIVTLDADNSCSIEKVLGICCNFTPMVGNGEEEHLFLPEIGKVRDAIEQINVRHQAFIRYRSDTLNELKEKLQEHLDGLQPFLTDLENKSERAKAQAAQLVQKAHQLSKRYEEMSSETSAAEKIEQERKQLLHFMLDMKNRLLRQAIETDSLWVQANAEKANIERLLQERSQSQT